VAHQPDDLYLQALCLAEVILRTFEHQGKLDVSSKPIPRLRPIVQSNQRMKIMSLDKFDGTTYIGTINFFKDQEDLKAKKAVGALIVYIGDKYIVDLFNQMGYPGLDESNDEELQDAVGTFCNIIAGKFKLALTQLGFIELEMSHFSTYRDAVKDGIPFDYRQSRKYEITFEIDEGKALVVELTMGPVPKVEAA